MDLEQVQRALLDRFSLRIQPAMSAYVLKHLQSKTNDEIPVMGSHARTGVPVRQHISLAAIQSSPSEVVSPGV